MQVPRDQEFPGASPTQSTISDKSTEEFPLEGLGSDLPDPPLVWSAALGSISLTVVVSAVGSYLTTLGIARCSTDVTVAYKWQFSARQPRCPSEDLFHWLISLLWERVSAVAFIGRQYNSAADASWVRSTPYLLRTHITPR